MNYKINNLFFNFTSMSNVVGNFWISPENLEKCQRQVPIYAIASSLTQEQKTYVQWNMISIKHLTEEQLNEVEEALAFDEAVAKLRSTTVHNVAVSL